MSRQLQQLCLADVPGEASLRPRLLLWSPRRARNQQQRLQRSLNNKFSSLRSRLYSSLRVAGVLRHRWRR